MPTTAQINAAIQFVASNYTPQPKQHALHVTPARAAMYGGAAGGGKSVALRQDAVINCIENPGLVAGIFRRTLPELKANHIRFLRLEIPEVLGKWYENDKEFRFWNGSIIRCGYAESEGDIERYQGQEIPWMGIEEAGQFTAFQIEYLVGRNRAGSWKASDNRSTTCALPRMILTANPGGISHSYLKERYIDKAAPMTIFDDIDRRDPDDPRDLGWPTIFIPASAKDNKYLDKGYAAQFSGLPEELAKALRDGDWDIVVGSYFGDIFRREKHVLKPFKIPDHWTRFRSFDWGSAAPFCVGWYAVASEDYEINRDSVNMTIPRGSLIKYREYYGASGPNKGLKMNCELVALSIREREAGEVISYGVADPAIWKIESGPSIGERMMRAGVNWRRADNSRIAGWDQLRRRLIGEVVTDDNGESRTTNRPHLYFFDTCVDTVRTLPLLTHDSVRIEDIDTKQEDHAADETRYAMMSRPFESDAPAEPEDPWKEPTIQEWMERSRASRKSDAYERI
jgi:hypothetical protein